MRKVINTDAGLKLQSGLRQGAYLSSVVFATFGIDYAINILVLTRVQNLDVIVRICVSKTKSKVYKSTLFLFATNRQ